MLMLLFIVLSSAVCFYGSGEENDSFEGKTLRVLKRFTRNTL